MILSDALILRVYRSKWWRH